MFGLQFVQSSANFLHSKDLDDMQAAFLSDDDNLTKENASAPRSEQRQQDKQIAYLSEHL
ncbi:hypothetical protein [Ruegeria atlantica]|uniref:hypothetical protein n=1 Tax=Ruegeria atlantica TaxID=81569 RepID=UPI00147B2165|nr:hypothetical protein [Ruegeria atlantica]